MIKNLLICFILFLTANFTYADTLYKDVPADSPYMTILRKINERGFMRGYTDNTFRPKDPVTRAEWSNIIINALELNKHSVLTGVEFKDLDIRHPYYEACQIALYYDLVNVETNNFYPNQAIKREEAIGLLTNYLSKKSITLAQAKNILGKYTDKNSLNENQIILFAKADLFGLIPITTKENKINLNGYLTRIDTAIILNNIKEEQKYTYEKTIEQYIVKKKAHGTKIPEAYLNDNVGIIPVKTLIPIQMLSKADSQKSQLSDKLEAIIPWTLTTKDRYLLIKAGAKLDMKITDVGKRKLLIRNGKLTIETTNITTKTGQTAPFEAVLVLDDSIGPNKFWKFKRIKTTSKEKSYIKILKDVKIDLTTGLILN